MGFFLKLKERKEAFLKVRASNIEKKHKKRSERLLTMQKENKLLRAEAQAKKEFKDTRRENFRLNNPLLAKAGDKLKKNFADNKKNNTSIYGSPSSSPFSSKGKKKGGNHGKGVFW